MRSEHMLMRAKMAIVLVGLGWLLLACSAKGQMTPGQALTSAIQATAARPTWTPTVASTPTSTVTPTVSPLPSPWATPMLRATATATSRLAPTITPGLLGTPWVSVEGVAADGTCLSVNESITITAQVFEQPDFEKDLEAYLNAGGSIRDLPGALASTSAERPIRMQLVGEDITANGIPDLLIGITLPYAAGDGETHLLFFACIEGLYEGEVLFRRAGAGSRMEGLYAGGGVLVEHVGDLNANGKAEVLFSVNWPGYAEVFVVEWDEGQFASLIEYRDLLGNPRYWIEVLGQGVEIADVEGDGLYEIVVSDQVGAEGTVTWRWNGERYSPDGD
jgi:hypothetical protein